MREKTPARIAHMNVSSWYLRHAHTAMGWKYYKEKYNIKCRTHMCIQYV